MSRFEVWCRVALTAALGIGLAVALVVAARACDCPACGEWEEGE